MIGVRLLSRRVNVISASVTARNGVAYVCCEHGPRAVPRSRSLKLDCAVAELLTIRRPRALSQVNTGTPSGDEMYYLKKKPTN